MGTDMDKGPDPARNSECGEMERDAVSDPGRVGGGSEWWRELTGGERDRAWFALLTNGEMDEVSSNDPEAVEGDGSGLMRRELAEMQGDDLRLNLHHGQYRAWKSEKRFVIVTAGTQGGKTSFGPYWLLREIWRQGPGDYLIVTPTFPLLERKLLGEFRRLFETKLHLGRYRSSPTRIFEFSEEGGRWTHKGRYSAEIPTRVQFGYAENSQSLESMTAKAAWLDEAGQKKFKLESWQAVLRRLSLAQGRVLITTSVYALHWLKGLVEKAADGGQGSGDRGRGGEIEVVRFESTANPNFAIEEFERARMDLPHWKFNMLYRGMFERPAGLIYDCINEETQKIPRFAIPRTWNRYLGLDFGTQNMAGTFWAEEPAVGDQWSGVGRLYCYRIYHAAGESARGHVRRLLTGEPHIPYAVGGSRSEDDWRKEFQAAGLPMRAPKIKEVEVGIDRVYGAFQRQELFVFDDLTELWDELTTYSRVLDEDGNPTEKIENKEMFHLLDAMRYVISDLKGGVRKLGSERVEFYGNARRRTEDSLVRGADRANGLEGRTRLRSTREIEELMEGA